MKITPIQNIKVTGSKKQFFAKNSYGIYFKAIDKDIFIAKNLVKNKNEVEPLFEDISNKIFPNEKEKAELFTNLLSTGKIGLSSSFLKSFKNPGSAIGIKIKPNEAEGKIITSFSKNIMQGKGIGINLSEFSDPKATIRKINSYFKYKENLIPKIIRKPAGIALLNVNHNKILDFITMKDNEDYKDWCFDISVIICDDFLQKVDSNEEITLDNGIKIPAGKIYNTLINSMFKKGEPGIIFSNNKDYICDSCGAKELTDRENFTISHINLSEFYNNKNNSVNEKELNKVSNILALAMAKTDSNGCIGVVGYQELLDKMNYKYGERKALNILQKCLNIVQKNAHKYNIKTAISPTGTVSKYLNVTPNIQPSNYKNLTYYNQLDTIAAAQKYIDCNISNTIILNKDNNVDDIDKIIRYSSKNKLKGITVFKP